jgi:hypothetical protein
MSTQDVTNRPATPGPLSDSEADELEATARQLGSGDE